MSAPGPLASLSPGLRRLLAALFGTTFVLLIFVYLPLRVSDWNAAQDWPRWAHPAARIAGALLFLASLGLVFHCSGLFARIGRGTPVPLDPPTTLVAQDVYRRTRNPMYLGQVGILLAFFLVSGELALLLYALFWAACLHGFVVLVEEPDLRRRFGEPYEAYCRTVPRWLGRRAR